MSTEIHDESYWESNGLGIAGRQWVSGYKAIRGDLVINCFDERFIESFSELEYNALCVKRIYRKIPVASQGDCDSGRMEYVKSCKEAIDLAKSQLTPLKQCDCDKRMDCTDDIQIKNLPAGIVVEDKAKTNDDGKPPLARLPWSAIRELSMVQLYGQQKYGDFENYRKGIEISRNLSCAVRHIADFMDGIDNDPESGRSHLGHALCRLAFVVQNIKDGTAIDDRYKQPEKSQ